MIWGGGFFTHSQDCMTSPCAKSGGTNTDTLSKSRMRERERKRLRDAIPFTLQISKLKACLWKTCQTKTKWLTNIVYVTLEQEYSLHQWPPVLVQEGPLTMYDTQQDLVLFPPKGPQPHKHVSEAIIEFKAMLVVSYFILQACCSVYLVLRFWRREWRIFDFCFVCIKMPLLLCSCQSSAKFSGASSHATHKEKLML